MSNPITTSHAGTPTVTTVLINSINHIVQSTATSSITSASLTSTPALNSQPVSITTTTSTTTTTTPSQVLFNNQEEKVYKKEKQILIEFDSKTKDLKSQLNEGIKCLEQRLDTQISILVEIQDFFKKRAEVEMQYSRDLDKLIKSIYARHKSEKTKRESWHLHSTYKLWESLLNDTKQHSKYHQVASDICSKYVADKFDDIIDDIKRMFMKCKSIGLNAHEEIFKVVGELNGAMKTYHEYQSESKQAEAKLKYVQSQKPKYEKQKSKKKLKHYEKQVEKRLQKYTETKVKAFKARNEYILSIDSANACINKFCTDDIGDIVDCSDFGFHSSVAKCIYMYLSAQENVKRSRQQSVDNISRSIGDLDSNSDKQKFLDYFQYVFNIQKKFQFEPHKGDEVSQVNAQSLIRYEMEKRFEQLDVRLKTLKTENDEIFKTIEATEKSLLNYFDIKNCDMSDLFRDLNIPNYNHSQTKEKRIEIEDYYVQKVRQYTTSSNLIARLEARHRMMQKALNGTVNSSDKTLDKLNNQISFLNQEKKKKIGKSPLIGQPRLFGGKLLEYINVTKQEIPQIITSCVRAINRLGLHNQGIFRIPGSQLEINQFKEAFEKGEDPLITVNPREMNSVAGVLKLYLRELKEPLFPRELYDTFINSLRVSTSNNQMSNSLVLANSQNNNETNSFVLNSSDMAMTASTSTTIGSPIENIEAMKVDNIRKAMCLVNKPIYIILRYLFAFLNHLSEFKDENMMDAYNIAICLAPSLIPVPEDKKDQVNHQTDTIELIKLIIQHNEEIFSMECDGPVYEKFDSDIDDRNSIEISEDEEEEESDKQFMRNLSDDELYATEAIALYDYKGRSEKELSFKKGAILAIRGQLSADWWQGSLVLPNLNPNTPTRVGYIPDKYIALRASKKMNLTNMSTPQSVSLNHTSSISSKMTNSSVMTNSMRDTQTQENINQIMKESDILNDDDNESSSSASNKYSASFRSPNLSYQAHKNIYIKKRNSSVNSNSYEFNNLNSNNSNTLNQNFLTLTPSNNNANNYSRIKKLNNSFKQIENSNLDEFFSKNKSFKMNQIEDALASVLDDMKQLDFSANQANNSSNSSKLGSIKLESNLINKTPSFKRPDLVIDLPVNLNSNNQAIINLNNNNNSQKIQSTPKSINQIIESCNQSRSHSIDRVSSCSSNNSPKLINETNKSSTNNAINNKHIEELKSFSTTSESTSSSNSLTSSSISSINSINCTNKTKKLNTESDLLDMKQFNLDLLNKISDDKENNDTNSLNSKKIHKNEVVTIIKKQPPPLLKKPEISDEILKKLGKSPTSDLSSNQQQLQQQQQQQQQQNQLNSPTSSISSITSSNNKSNLSIRLSNSKATDV